MNEDKRQDAFLEENPHLGPQGDEEERYYETWVAVTGHRPPKIGGYDGKSPLRLLVNRKLEKVIVSINKEEWDRPKQTVLITGGALGVDTDAAYIAAKNRIPYIVAVPCNDHSKMWPKAAREEYQHMLNFSRKVEVIHKGDYHRLCMQQRNMWMINHCDKLIAVWDGSSGGTANCVKYAQDQGKEIIFINLDKE